jgi:CRISPR-associated exonuclease Cas4
MYISHVKIRGFRSLQNVDVNLVSYNTLIGKNDSGKSSCLQALQTLFDPNTPLAASDVCSIEGHDGECMIEATIENCGNELAENGKLSIRRSINQGFQYKCKVPTNNLVRQMFEGTYMRGSLNEFPDDIKDFIRGEIDNVSDGGRLSIDEAKELFRRLSETNLVAYGDGWTTLDPQILDSLVQVVFLTASMRGEEELQDNRTSVLTKVGGQILREATDGDAGIAEALENLDAQIQRVTQKGEDGNWVIDGLNRFEEILEEEIHRFDEGVTSESHIVGPRLPRVDFSIGVDIRDECVTGLDHMGHGLRRSVVFAMLRTYKRLKQEVPRPAGAPEPPLYLFLIEEPELYLHPQAERRRMIELRDLAGDENAQVVLCTHSAMFVNLNDYKGIHRFERPGRQATNVIGWTGPDAGADVAEALSLIWRTNLYRSAMVFADLVILVEGVSEQAAIPHVARKMGLTSPDLEVEVVSCDGNSNIPPIQTILEGLRIKYVAWLDNEKKDDKAEVEKAKDIRTQDIGRIVTTDLNWEKMNKLTAGSENKIYKSWKYFIQDDQEPNDSLKERMTAAYNWEDFGI